MVKTVTLTSNIERAVAGLNGKHAIVRNFSNETIYVGTSAGVMDGFDNVQRISGLRADIIRNIPNGTIYIVTSAVTATVECEGTDYINQSFSHDLSGGSFRGVVSYSNLSNKPSINGAILSDNLNLADNKTLSINPDGTMTAMCTQPNLLINSNFKINQRSSSYYDNGYSVDRWFISDGEVNISDQGIKVGYGDYIPSANPAVLSQKIETAFSGDVTLTVNVGEVFNTNPSATIGYLYNGIREYIKSETLNIGDNVISGTIPEGASDIIVSLHGADANLGDAETSYTLFKYAKLENGKISTQYIVPDVVTELARCQRYTMVLDNSFKARAVTITADAIEFFVNTPATLRNIPLLNTADLLVSTLDGTGHIGFTFSIPKVTANGFILMATKTAHGLIDAIICTINEPVVFNSEL